MLKWFLNISKSQPEYGAISLYGVQNPEPVNILMNILRYAVLPVVIPVILTVGILVYMRKKAYPIAKRVWAVVIMLTVYFALLIGAGFLFDLY